MNGCEHMQFRADVEVARLRDSGAFIAEVKVQCNDCNERFVFVGLPSGFSVHEAAMSPFGHEARLPIRPASDMYREIQAPGYWIRSPRDDRGSPE